MGTHTLEGRRESEVAGGAAGAGKSGGLDLSNHRLSSGIGRSVRVREGSRIVACYCFMGADRSETSVYYSRSNIQTVGLVLWVPLVPQVTQG